MDALRDWASFGKPRESQLARVKRGDWKVESFSKPIITPWELSLPDDSVNKLLAGFLPKNMDDKWFVYTEGPDTEGNAVVHIIRSWTGFAIADVQLKLVMGDNGQPQDFGAKFTQLTWESDDERARLRTPERVKESVISVCKFQLGIKSLETHE